MQRVRNGNAIGLYSSDCIFFTERCNIRAKYHDFRMSSTNVQELKKSKMSLMGVVALIFSFVAAGAFGIEEAVSASGPGVTLAMLIIFPFVWSFPLCEMVGELGSIYPTEGGIYSWGREAFGEFWGWQVGLWAGISTWLSQAQYCALIAGYSEKIFDLTPTTEYLLKVGVVIIFTIVNIMGLTWLEKLETVFMVLIVLAFLIVTVVGFLNWNYSPVAPVFNKDVGLFHSVGDGIAIIIWMYCGYECMSNMAEEVDDPQKIPKAMRLSQPIIALSYILPTLAGLVAIGSWRAWATESGGGHVGYADVLIQYVGSWAGVLFIVIAIISNCSIFCSYIAHGSRAFFVMADDHMFPKIMKKVDKRGIPTASIILLAIFTIITCKFDFTTLVMATTPIQLYIYFMLIACVFAIRKRYPVEFRKEMGLNIMPGGKFGIGILTGCVFIICTFAIYANGVDYFLTGFIVLIIGPVAYILCKWIYKGQALDDPEVYPLNKKTRLGLGDLIDLGVYVFLVGIISFIGSIFLWFYEKGYGVEEYAEAYGSGLLSDFYGMINLCRWLGIILMVGGGILWYVGKKTEGEKLKALKTSRDKKLDDRIRGIHGKVPNGKSE